MKIIIQTSLILLFLAPVSAQPPDHPKTESDGAQSKESPEPLARPDFEIPGIPLNQNGTVKLDRERKRLLLVAHVCLREGVLEMLVCKKQTKEHEAILTIDADAFVIHTGLLALKAEPGKPVRYEPDYKAPTGTKIDIFLTWKDRRGKLQRMSARKWIRHATRRYYVAPFVELPKDLDLNGQDALKHDPNAGELFWYDTMSAKQRDELLKLSKDKKYRRAIADFYRLSQPRPMNADWVFTGSGFHKDEETGQKYYLAESGDVICVANFASAMIDVALKSSSNGSSSLMFEAATQAIPELGTPVMIELIPRPEPDKTGKKPAGMPE